MPSVGCPHTPPPQGLSSGAHPTKTFPNAHLAPAVGAGKHPCDASRGYGGSAWSAPVASACKSALEQLQEAVNNEDWAGNFAEGRTKFQAQPSWSAGPERCAVLQCIATMCKAKNVLEIGSFCGAAALAMAESIPKDGRVVALELEPFFVEFGQKFRSRSKAGSIVNTVTGPAAESLHALAAEAESQGSSFPAFDLVVIDGDKASMQEYFEKIWKSPNLLNSKSAVVCVDTTHFKGQVPTRYARFGMADQWTTSSGEEEINALRTSIMDTAGFTSHEFGGLLVVQHVAPEPEFDESPESDRS